MNNQNLTECSPKYKCVAWHMDMTENPGFSVTIPYICLGPSPKHPFADIVYSGRLSWKQCPKFLWDVGTSMVQKPWVHKMNIPIHPNHEYSNCCPCLQTLPRYQVVDQSSDKMMQSTAMEIQPKWLAIYIHCHCFRTCLAKNSRYIWTI